MFLLKNHSMLDQKNSQNCDNVLVDLLHTEQTSLRFSSKIHGNAFPLRHGVKIQTGNSHLIAVHPCVPAAFPAIPLLTMRSRCVPCARSRCVPCVPSFSAFPLCKLGLQTLNVLLAIRFPAFPLCKLGLETLLAIRFPAFPLCKLGLQALPATRNPLPGVPALQTVPADPERPIILAPVWSVLPKIQPLSAAVSPRYNANDAPRSRTRNREGV